ncbi:MAG: hypothetical protein WD355_08465 [Balneolaceae bacterium]
MKYLTLTLILISSTSVIAQQIEIQPGSDPAHYELYEYPLKGTQFMIEDQLVRLIRPDGSETTAGMLALDRSGNGEFLQILYQEGELISELFDADGSLINRIQLENFDSFDETLDVRQFEDGRFVTRDNVANFTFFESDGSIRYQISNSSQNPDGESVSELASDPAGTTIVLYNPRINYGEHPGSRARIVNDENDTTELLSSQDRAISHLSVTSSGSFIHLITEQDGSGDQLHIFDRFGNQLTEFNLEENLSGTHLTEDGSNLTVWFGNRVQVYRTVDMERIGSVSLASSIVHAEYHHEDQQMVALGGTTGADRRVTNPAVYSVHLQERQIASSEVNAPLSMFKTGQVGIERIRPGSYRFVGLNGPLEFQTSF